MPVARHKSGSSKNRRHFGRGPSENAQYGRQSLISSRRIQKRCQNAKGGDPKTRKRRKDRKRRSPKEDPRGVEVTPNYP